jgi:hypothetical protein
MDFLKRYDYRGEVEYQGNRFEFSAAAPEDADEIAEMYGEIAINAANCNDKLNPGHKDCFSRVGGMFEIHTRESIIKEMNGGRSCFAVVKDSAGRIAACLWFALDDSHFTDFCPGGFPGCEGCVCTMAQALREDKVAHPRELIVRPGRLHNAAHVMFYTILRTLWQNGYTHSLFEVYGVKGYECEGEHFALDMLNRRSFEMSLATGAKYIGDSPELCVRLGPFSVTISPKVFCCDYAAILSALGQKLEDEGIAITFWGEALEKHQGEDSTVVSGGIHNVAGFDRPAH